ncbi:MAG TPA: alpha/beta fold hydrolase [Candidatus Dormibacteraeota bacterium]|nr:alpha/beta fold hydrolase [Candidatus Dormibacteraeota bacterium]
MPSTLDAVRAPDGTRLVRRRWTPSSPAWARVQLVHGLGEHLGRWEAIGDTLASHGLEVVGADLRGFGASGGPRADLDRWSRFHDDLDEQLAGLRAARPELPVVLYGHSMGSVIALGQLLSGHPTADVAVLTGPGLDDDLARWKHALAPILGRVAPGLRFANGIHARDLSARPRDGFEYDDPLVLTRSTTRFGAIAFAEQARLQRAVARLDAMPVPTLVIRGGDDPIVPARGLLPFRRLGNVTVREYPGLRHEVHNEVDGERVLAEMVAWIREALAARV